MRKGFTISIPKPCTENWNDFVPTATGGFCGSCSKNVIDFTKATDEDIIRFISKKPEHACGRFTENQLKSYEVITPVTLRPGYTLLKAGALSLLLFPVSRNTSAQIFSEKPVTEINQQPSAKTSIQSVGAKDLTVQGSVKSAVDSLGLIGPSVVVKGTSIGVQVDIEGHFELQLPSSKIHTLIVSYVGYKKKLC